MPTYIPSDRSDKNPSMGCCYNPACKPDSKTDRLEFEVPAGASTVKCPKCGCTEAPYVHLLVTIHLLVLHPEGKIVGEGGLRYKIACASERPYIATHTNMEAGTGNIKAANCKACLAAAAAMPKVNSGGYEMRAK